MALLQQNIYPTPTLSTMLLRKPVVLFLDMMKVWA